MCNKTIAGYKERISMTQKRLGYCKTNAAYYKAKAAQRFEQAKDRYDGDIPVYVHDEIDNFVFQRFRNEEDIEKYKRDLNRLSGELLGYLWRTGAIAFTIIGNATEIRDIFTAAEEMECQKEK